MNVFGRRWYRGPGRKAWGVSCLLLAVAACTTPAAKLERHALTQGLLRSEVKGAGFEHVIYRKPDTDIGDFLHVYLDGDGTPWKRRHIVAADPTPRTPLVLDLMAKDRQSSLYLARPCYSIDRRPPGCTPYLWTHGRYAPEVVASMRTALQSIIATEGVEAIVLLGYSGGGTLAMLLAREIAQTRAVVTIGANLDIDAWAAAHGYAPLSGSINPVDLHALPSDIVQLHYVGALDTNTPPALVLAAAKREVAATVRIVPEFDHVCCWRQAWVSILGSLESELEPRYRRSSAPSFD